METLIIIALIVGGLILFAIEVFLIPGISIAGIGSAVCILYAIYSAFTSLGSEAGFITLGVSLLGIIGVTWWFMRSKTVDRLSLKKTLDYRQRTHHRGAIGRQIHRRKNTGRNCPHQRNHCLREAGIIPLSLFVFTFKSKLYD